MVRAAGITSDYSVVAITRITDGEETYNKTYHATTNAEGEFELTLTANEPYMLAIVHEGAFVGPTVFAGGDDEVNEVIKPGADTDLGDIVIDPESGFARTESEPDCLDPDTIARAEGGVPFGAAADGKDILPEVTPRDDSDEDMDGIPNLFDADEDNDGFRNGIIIMPSASTVMSENVESVFISSNIWAQHQTTSDQDAKDLISMRLNVIPKEGKEDLIKSVKCVGVPAIIANTATIFNASSLGNPDDYPQEGTLWDDPSVDYHLYWTGTLNQWIVAIIPHEIMSIGDTFTVRVSYDEEGEDYEDFFLTMSYVLTDWAKITTYNDTALPDDEGSKFAPAEYDADELEIVFAKPLDEDQAVLEGLTYTVRYGPTTCPDGQCLVPEDVIEAPVEDVPGSPTLSFSIPTEVAQTYYVVPVAGSVDGQRNGEEVWFTRQ